MMFEKSSPTENLSSAKATVKRVKATEFTAFEKLTRKLLTVPKEELDEARRKAASRDQ